MKTPNILRLLPPRLAQSVFYRVYNRRQKNYEAHFKSASLRLNSRITMHDLIAGDVISGQIALSGFYEWQLSRVIYNSSKHGGLFIDVGANIGYFSLLWLSGNKSNRVVSVEASPRNQQFIENNLRKNGFADRCTLIKKAAGDIEKEVSFDLGPDEQTGWGGISSGIEGTASVTVDMIRLDSIVSEKIAVMKIDVEGADTLVIKGCEKLLKSKMIGAIYFEQHIERMNNLGIKEGDAQKFLSSLDYTCTQFGGDEWMAVPNN